MLGSGKAGIVQAQVRATYFHDKRSLKHLDRARSALLGSHAATKKIDSPRSPIDHALKKCVPCIRDSMQVMKTQGVMRVNRNSIALV